MFVVFLKFSKSNGPAGQCLDGHKEWIKRGFDDDLFLLAGSLQPSLGGAILAHNTTLADLEGRVDDDPFVAEDVVTAEIHDLTASRADAKLGFLLN